MSIVNTFVYIMFFLSFSFSSMADLVALEDVDLGEVDGEGIGIVLEDFVFNAGQSVNGGTFEIRGLQTSSDKNVVLGISQFYVAGSGSNQGANVLDNPVNIGRLTNPFKLELRDGIDVGVFRKAVFEFSAPTTSEGASRTAERPDMGIRFGLNINGIDYQSLEGHIESLSLDDSYVRLWGSRETHGRMEGELALHINTPYMEFFACNANGGNCGTSVNFQTVVIEVELGSGQFQPVTFEVDGLGNFNLKVGSLQGKCSSINGTGGCNPGAERNVLVDYYNSGPKSNVYFGNVSVGGQSFGAARLDDLQIQYLDVKSHDL